MNVWERDAVESGYWGGSQSLMISVSKYDYGDKGSNIGFEETSSNESPYKVEIGDATLSIIFIGYKALFDSEVTSVVIRPVVQNPESVTLYLGRSDIQRSFGSSKGSNQGYLRATGFIFSGNLFNEEDIGKTVPVWISTEPPPY